MPGRGVATGVPEETAAIAWARKKFRIHSKTAVFGPKWLKGALAGRFLRVLGPDKLALLSMHAWASSAGPNFRRWRFQIDLLGKVVLLGVPQLWQLSVI